MLRKLIVVICAAAALNVSAGLTGASAAPPHGGSHAGGHAAGAHPGLYGGRARGGGWYGGPGYGYGYYPYGYDEGYDEGSSIAAGIIGTAMGLITASQYRYHHCWWHNHHRVCR